MGKPITINDLLFQLDKLGVIYSAIAGGYYIAKLDTYLLCKCDGNAETICNRCQQCGEKAYICQDCLDKHLVFHCNRCAYETEQVFRAVRRESSERLKADLGMTDEEFSDFQRRIKELGEKQKGDDATSDS